MKTALVTGANGGFGKLIALELIKSGYFVIAAMRNRKKQAELIEEVTKLQLEHFLEVVEMDVTDENQIQEVTSWIHSRFNRLDVLVNNAGYSQGGFTDHLAMKEWKDQFDVNFFGVIQVTKNLLPLLEQSETAKIINLSSVSGILGFPGMGPYSASKFAVEGYSESLRLELLRKNIFVSVVEPASYKTGIWERGLEISATIPREDRFKNNTLAFAKRAYENAGDPNEVAVLIKRICETNRPKFRYTVGKGATSLRYIKKFIPWSIIEKSVINRLK
ncbi:SDR family oxidoreductase [Ornithinibacillus scapharcae]|uniref:SDR family oxidoreductase n=1 Tax=Ornithinibacillus scapharcae TaxID=1147159 RepID=UPI000225AFEC|nr:SDR family oxidoreductase [Ornithinibacillus scapharcae]